jgi:hypothetical protein
LTPQASPSIPSSSAPITQPMIRALVHPSFIADDLT